MSFWIRGGRLRANECILLLTATVRVNPEIPGVSAPDAEERLEEYRKTLRYALDLRRGPRRIVVAENSGEDLTLLAREVQSESHGKRVELLSWPGNEFPGEFGKGFGEAMLLDGALDRAQWIQGDDVVVKLTGRQRVLNLVRLLERLPEELVLGCDLRRTSVYRRLGLAMASGYCDTRLLVFRRSFYETSLRGCASQHRRGEFNLEDALYSLASSLIGREGVLPRWPLEPSFRGLAGHWGKDYGSVRERLKRGTRAALRRVAPTLWV